MITAFCVLSLLVIAKGLPKRKKVEKAASYVDDRGKIHLF